MARKSDETRSNFTGARLSSATTCGYFGDWRRFNLWCAANRRTALPASTSTVVSYLQYLLDLRRKVSTIEHALVSIGKRHTAFGVAAPHTAFAVHKFMCKARRVAPKASSKSHISESMLRALVGAVPFSIVGDRDRALLTVGFYGALRRSEIVKIDVRDLNFTKCGVEVTVRRGKSRARTVWLQRSNTLTCPVAALKQWIKVSCTGAGPVFRRLGRKYGGRPGARLSPAAVSVRVKRYCRLIGFDERDFAGHSLRSVRQCRQQSVTHDLQYAAIGHMFVELVVASAALGHRSPRNTIDGNYLRSTKDDDHKRMIAKEFVNDYFKLPSGAVCVRWALV